MQWNPLQFLIDYKIPHWTEGKNVRDGYINVRCPNCGDKSNHGQFNPYTGGYYCWRCGGQSTTYIISLLTGMSSRDSEKIIWTYTGHSAIVNKLNRKTEKAVKIELPGEELKSIHRRYLKRRGFDPEYLVNKYQITGTGPIGRYKFRIVIPIIGLDARIVSFQARDVTDIAELRYIGLGVEESVIHYKKLLYGQRFVKGNRVVVVEGIFDQWRIGDGCVATFGTSMTPHQLHRLSLYQNVFFLFDNEPTAQSRARDYAQELSALGIHTEIIQMDNEGDPAELPADDVAYLRKELLL